MTTTKTKLALTRAVREIALALAGLFEIHDAESELIEESATALRRILERHQRQLGANAPGESAGSAPFEALLADIELTLDVLS